MEDVTDIAPHVHRNRSTYLKNAVLVKPTLGKTKRSVYDLPASPDHVYGKRLPRDKEGAREVVLSWDYGKRSKSHPFVQSDRTNFVYLNKRATQAGVTRTHEARRFHMETLESDPRAKIRPSNFRSGKAGPLRAADLNRSRKAHTLPSQGDSEHTYGLKIVKKEHARDLIRGESASSWRQREDARHQQERRRMKRERRRRKRVQERLLRSNAGKNSPTSLSRSFGGFGPAEHLPPGTRWKMQKFADVPSRLRTQGSDGQRDVHGEYGLAILRKSTEGRLETSSEGLVDEEVGVEAQTAETTEE